ncbi:TetR/AcrR family transcriptional regulator [Paenibacillus glycinis]|uniref:TetR family transcriptional regulator n=1 Tax=Paenibacillus glycinis TaxID=2697035 RepID=A0ABW9XRI1_9BACL|nr:TetR/AcrR family transcriptional regulator [Paenibacillus glycinis]NBD24957.1 TetR family transcriptional regulator [Paenibacillus glycinis]
MSTADRRILKSQEAIKSALIALMTEKKFDQITIGDISSRANVGRRTIYLHYLDKYDLLDHIILEHINELRTICETAGSEMSFAEGGSIWFAYLERKHAFFSSMLQSKEAASFRSRFFAFVIERLAHHLNVSEGVNQGLSKDVLLHFFGNAVVGIVESWFNDGLSEPADVVAQQVGRLLDRNL